MQNEDVERPREGLAYDITAHVDSAMPAHLTKEKELFSISQDVHKKSRTDYNI